ncbi:MAG TPA: hypothetical protein VMH28_18020 [Candidatus Acidoferrales bacterium]|nr:hypothetical protein [Candidatus Acidoferrales bacterium]
MSVEDQRTEVQRILQSPEFRRAPKLQRFLELVCDYHFQNRSAEINEYVIATVAFGKGPDFEPGKDSLVRVQAREVRRRLREYYQNEGKSSRLTMDIPIGHYTPVFTQVEDAAARAAPARRQPTLRSAWLVLAGTVLACAALLVAADHERRLLIRTASAAGRNAAPVSASVGGLWNRFLDSDVATVLVVSNPEVKGCADERSAAAGCPDEYTGMGEAVAIHLITSLFRPAKQTLIVKPSRIVTADDVKRYNLILVGGKSVNVWTRRLGADLSLAEPNMPPEYQTVLDTKTGQVTKDRAIVALRKYPATGRWVLFLWGRHSQGTHAAAEASTDDRFLAQLKWPGAPFPESFHVLVSVNVNDGIPQRPVPVMLHVP